MFGRGKRKSQDQDEDLLVPHGLIWQATDEPREPAEANSTAPETWDEVDRTPAPQENRPAVPVVPSTQQPSLRSANPSPSRLGAISPPIPWPSAKTASVIRRMPPPTTPPLFPGATVPSVKEPHQQPLLHDAATPRQRDKVEVVDLTTTAQAGESPSPREAMTQVLERLVQRVESIGRATGGFCGQVRGTARAAFCSINLRSRTQRLNLAKEKWIDSLRSPTRLAGQSFPQWSSSLARLGRMKSAIGRFSSETSRSWLLRPANLGRRIQNHKIRIRIMKSAGAQKLIKQSTRAWAERKNAIRREPRLWMSMTMAAASAMLTLGIISAVSHYAPGADASNKAVASPAQGNSGVINPKIVVAPRTSPPTTKASGSAPAVVSAPAKPGLAPEKSTQRSATRRAHRNSDEGYVAPDSYHYYGKNGKSR